MALTGAVNTDASKSVFNDFGQIQCNVGTVQLGSSPLSPAFALATLISSMAQSVQTNKEQIAALLAFVKALLNALNARYCTEQMLNAQTSVAIQNLNE
jgi:hypothetical protein